MVIGGGSRFISLVGILVILTPGCGSEPAPAPTCVAGKVESCPCQGGGTGTQTCADDGKSWGPCTGCKSQKDAGPTKDVRPVDGPMPDGPSVDAPRPDARPLEASAPEAALPDGPPLDKATPLPDKATPLPDKATPPPDKATPLPDKATPDAPVVDYKVLPDSAPPTPDGGSVSGAIWSQVKVTNKSINLNYVWGSGPNDVYAVGSFAGAAVLHYDGRKRSGPDGWWDFKSLPGINVKSLHGVCGTSSQDVVFSANPGFLLFWNGDQIKSNSVAYGKTLRNVYCSDRMEVMVGSGDVHDIYYSPRRTTPPSIQTVKIATATGHYYRDFWGKGSALYALADGVIQRRDQAGTWKQEGLKPTKILNSIWGSSTKDIFVGGMAGTIYHYDGTTWSAMQSGSTANLHDIWGSGPADVFAVGSGGTVLHYDGSKWSAMSSGTNNNLNAVWGSAAADVYAVGDNGTIIHYAPCDCKVSGACHAAGERDDSGCSACVPSKSTTSLTPLSGVCNIGGQCHKAGETESSGCQVCDPTKSTTSWSQAAGKCQVGASCFPSGFLGYTTCQHCDPALSTTSWSTRPNTCQISGACYLPGEMSLDKCQACDPSQSTTAWSPAKNVCKVGLTCWVSGQMNPSGCKTCDPSQSTSGLSPAKDICTISGTCYQKGASDTTGCFVCDPAKSAYGWTLKSDRCHIGGTCYLSGASDPTGCYSCNPTANPASWSVKAGYCSIAARCYKSGERDASGCMSCDPTKSSSAWTPVAAPAGCPLTKRKVTFSHSTVTNPGNSSLATIQSDLTGYAALPGFPDITYRGLELVGQVQDNVALELDHPRMVEHLADILLPGDARLMGYRTSLSGDGGFMHVDSKGAITDLYRTTGGSYYSLGTKVAFSPDNKVAAAWYGNSVVLMRLDGATFTGGKSYVVQSLSGSTAWSKTAWLAVGASHVYALAKSGPLSGNMPQLWRAKLDGSGSLTQVALPHVGSAPPTYASEKMIASADGSVILLTAGSAYDKRDVIAVTDSTGVARNISNNPGDILEPTTKWGDFSSNSSYLYGAPMAASTKGSFAGWVRKAGSGAYDLHDVYVAPTTGFGTPDQVTKPANFKQPAYTHQFFYRHSALRFIDDKTMLFMTRNAMDQGQELFRYDAAMADLKNAAYHTSGSKPFSVKPYGTYNEWISGLWLGPQKKNLFYWIRYYNNTKQSTVEEIRAMDLGTWKRTTLVTNLEKIYALAHCASKSTLFFGAAPMDSATTLGQLYSLPMTPPGQAKQLSKIGKPTFSGDFSIMDPLVPSADCSHLVFRTRVTSYSSNTYRILAQKVDTPSALSAISDPALVNSHKYLGTDYAVSGDNTQVVFRMGKASNNMELFVAPLTANCCKPTDLYPSGTQPEYYNVLHLE